MSMAKRIAGKVFSRVSKSRSADYMKITLMDPKDMDEQLLGERIRHTAKSLESLTRTPYKDGKGEPVRKNLEGMLSAWKGRKLPETIDIKWARNRLEKFGKWKKTRKPLINPPKPAKPRDVLELIKTRRSVRCWQEKPVEKSKLLKILDAGRHAPCSCNRQPWKFIVVSHGAGTSMKKPGEVNVNMLEAAPILIYVAVDERPYHEEYAPAIDAAVAMQNMLLEAHSLALGACLIYQCESANQDELRKKLKLENHFTIYGVIVLGYPGEAPDKPERKPLEDIATFL